MISPEKKQKNAEQDAQQEMINRGIEMTLNGVFSTSESKRYWQAVLSKCSADLVADALARLPRTHDVENRLMRGILQGKIS